MNTDNFTWQCFLFVDFKYLNPTWDLKVGVPRIGNDRFQWSRNDLEISHIYVHTYEMVYSKLSHIIWKNPELYKCIVILVTINVVSINFVSRKDLSTNVLIVLVYITCTSNGRASLIQIHALTLRMHRCTGPIPISESENLAVFFKVLEKHKLS